MENLKRKLTEALTGTRAAGVGGASQKNYSNGKLGNIVLQLMFFFVGIPGIENELFEKIDILELHETSENRVET